MNQNRYNPPDLPSISSFDRHLTSSLGEDFVHRMESFAKYEGNADYQVGPYDGPYSSEYTSRFHQPMPGFAGPSYRNPPCDFRDFLSIPFRDQHVGLYRPPRVVEPAPPRRPLHSLQSEEDFLGVPGPANKEVDHFSLSRIRRSQSMASRHGAYTYQWEDQLPLPYRERPVHREEEYPAWPGPPEDRFWDKERYYGHLEEEIDPGHWRRGHSRPDEPRMEPPILMEQVSEERPPAGGKENRNFEDRMQPSKAKVPPCKSDLDLHWRRPTESSTESGKVVPWIPPECSIPCSDPWKYKPRSYDNRPDTRSFENRPDTRSGQDAAWRDHSGAVWGPTIRDRSRRSEWFPTSSERIRNEWMRKSKDRLDVPSKGQLSSKRKSRRALKKSRARGLPEADKEEPKQGDVVKCEVGTSTNAGSCQESDETSDAMAKINSRARRSKKRRMERKASRQFCSTQTGTDDSKGGINSAKEETSQEVVRCSPPESEKRSVNFRDGIDVIDSSNDVNLSYKERRLQPTSTHVATPATKDSLISFLDMNDMVTDSGPASPELTVHVGPIPEVSKNYLSPIKECSVVLEKINFNPRVVAGPKKLERRLSLSDGTDESFDSPRTILNRLDELAEEIDIKLIVEDGEEKLEGTDQECGSIEAISGRDEPGRNEEEGSCDLSGTVLGNNSQDADIDVLLKEYYSITTSLGIDDEPASYREIYSRDVVNYSGELKTDDELSSNFSYLMSPENLDIFSPSTFEKYSEETPKDEPHQGQVRDKDVITDDKLFSTEEFVSKEKQDYETQQQVFPIEESETFPAESSFLNDENERDKQLYLQLLAPIDKSSTPSIQIFCPKDDEESDVRCEQLLSSFDESNTAEGLEGSGVECSLQKYDKARGNLSEVEHVDQIALGSNPEQTAVAQKSIMDSSAKKREGNGQLNAQARSFIPKALGRSRMYVPGEQNLSGLDRTPRCSFPRKTVYHCYNDGFDDSDLMAYHNRPHTWPSRFPQPGEHMRCLTVQRFNERFQSTKEQYFDERNRAWLKRQVRYQSIGSPELASGVESRHLKSNALKCSSPGGRAAEVGLLKSD